MRYQKVFSKIWHDEKFKMLSDEAKLLFIYLLSSPHSNALGVYIMPSQYALADLNWHNSLYSKTLQELVLVGLIALDIKQNLVCIINHLKYNPIKNISHAKAIIKILKDLPQSPIYKYLKLQDKPYLHELLKALKETTCDTSSTTTCDTPCATPEEEEEEEEGEEEEEVLSTNKISSSRGGSGGRPAESAPKKIKKRTYKYKTLDEALNDKNLQAELLNLFPGIKWDLQALRMKNWAKVNNPKQDWLKFIRNWISNAASKLQTNTTEAEDPIDRALRLGL